MGKPVPEVTFSYIHPRPCPCCKSFSSSKVLVILILTFPMFRYEERIIELHSVIAELSKKMEEEKDDVIKEESECDESQV